MKEKCHLLEEGVEIKIANAMLGNTIKIDNNFPSSSISHQSGE